MLPKSPKTGDKTPAKKTHAQHFRRRESAAADEVGHSVKWAKFWGVSARTIRDWKREGQNVEDVPAMVIFCASRQKNSPGLQMKLAELRKAGHIGPQRVAPPAAGVAAGSAAPAGGLKQGEFDDDDPDWREHQEKKRAAQAAGIPVKDDNTLEDFRDVYRMKLTRNMREGRDPAEAKFLSDQVIKFDKAIRENKLLAEKLGIQSGETVAKDECIRWLRAWAFWTMRSLQAMLGETVPKLAAIAPGVTVDQVRAILEPAIFEHGMLKPFGRATKIAAALSLPTWFVATAKDTVDDYLENGAALMDAEFTPIPLLTPFETFAQKFSYQPTEKPWPASSPRTRGPSSAKTASTATKTKAGRPRRATRRKAGKRPRVTGSAPAHDPSLNTTLSPVEKSVTPTNSADSSAAL